jgi:KRAB domain-containing zinc finger protein
VLTFSLGYTQIEKHPVPHGGIACTVKSCRRWFKSQNLWNRHIKAHDKDSILLCDFCGKQFSNISNIERHRTLHTQGKQFLCPVKDCQRTFRRQGLLDDHIKEHNGEKFRCDICWKQLSWTTNLADHKETHPLCPFESCHRRFKSENLLNDHIETHNGKQLFPCTVEGCRRRFKSGDLLNQHIELHRCDICGRHCSDAWVLKRHKIIHTSSKSFACPFETCQKTFKRTDGLTGHIKEHRGKRFHCDICWAKRSSATSLASHMKTTHPLCLFEGCHRRFKSKKLLNNHIKEHNEKPFACTIEGCHWMFEHQYLLDNHIEEHNGEKFRCNTCWRKYPSRTKLAAHNETHPLCSFENCHWRFRTKERLDKHIKSHNENPFACTVEGCHWRFKREELLNKHIEAHNRGIQCVICRKPLLSADGVKRHMKSHILGGI